MILGFFSIGQRINYIIFKGRLPNWINYKKYVSYMASYPKNQYRKFTYVCLSLENSSRRKKGAFMFLNSNPVTYGEWLEDTIKIFIPFSDEENFVFINAWNE